MLIWKGWGIIIVPICGLSLFLTVYLVNSLTSDDRYFIKHNWPFALAMMIAGILTFIAGKKLPRKERHLIDQQTGQKVVLATTHSFFFIPLVYWGHLLFVLGTACYLLFHVMK
jgi:hypothetical protein